MKLLPAVALLAFVLSLCGLTGSGTDTSNNSGGGSDSAASGVSSDDAKHRLFQAAVVTRDESVMRDVSKRIGLTNENGMPDEKYAAFAKEHMGWIIKNPQFVRDINDPAKARAYIEQHK